MALTHEIVRKEWRGSVLMDGGRTRVMAAVVASEAWQQQQQANVTGFGLKLVAPSC